MDILVPVDGSDCSMRALDLGVDLAERYDATVHVVHFTDYEDEGTADIQSRVEAAFEDVDVSMEWAVVKDPRLSNIKVSDRVGKDVLSYIEDHEVDHVVMGHHSGGLVESAILGSAAKTVVETTTIPVTVVP